MTKVLKILQYTLQFAVLCNERLCCFFPVLFFCLFNVPHRSGIRVRRDLGGVCQDMWAAAGNNMVVGTDLAVDTSATATQLFSLTPPGITKLSQPVYTKFKGEVDNSLCKSVSHWERVNITALVFYKVFFSVVILSKLLLDRRFLVSQGEMIDCVLCKLFKFSCGEQIEAAWKFTIEDYSYFWVL